MDDIFSLDIKWLREFSDEYKKKVNLPFNCLAHPTMAKDSGLVKEADMELINKGKKNRYSSITVTKENFATDDYQRYALLITSIPLLSGKLVTKTIKTSPG